MPLDKGFELIGHLLRLQIHLVKYHTNDDSWHHTLIQVCTSLCSIPILGGLFQFHIPRNRIKYDYKCFTILYHSGLQSRKLGQKLRLQRDSNSWSPVYLTGAGIISFRGHSITIKCGQEEGGREGVSRKSTIGHVTKVRYNVKCPQLSTRGGRGQNWVKFGSHMQLLNVPLGNPNAT